MPDFSNILSKDSVLLEVTASGKDEVFKEAAACIERQHGLESKETLQSLVDREELGSTGLGHGVAIPHGRIKGLKIPVGVFMRLAAPVAFESPDGEPVSLVFVLLVPAQANETHLSILSQLAERFCNADFRQMLSSTSEPDAVFKLLVN